MSYKTEFRGTIYVHSSGRYSITGMPDFRGLPVPVIHEFNEQMNNIEELARKAKYINIPEQGVRIVLKKEDRQDARVVREYDFLARVYAYYRRYPDEPFFLSNAIIGRVELDDITHHANSPWAREDYFHWVLKNAKLFRHPIRSVRDPGRRGIWEYELPDAELGKEHLKKEQ